jgi:hypothetical protein
MKNNREYQKMMRGYFGKFTQYELLAILQNLDVLDINTISIQKTIDDYFICAVDKISVDNYIIKE